LKSTAKFLKAISQNYYLEFLIDIDDDKFDISQEYTPVVYKDKSLYEFDVVKIKALIKNILSNVYELYFKAKSEIYLEFSKTEYNDLENFVTFTIKALIVNLNLIKNDFYIDDQKSRYYSKFDEYFISVSLTQAYNNFLKENHSFIKDGNIDISKMPFDDELRLYSTYRFRLVSLLPFSLFNIGNAFLKDLYELEEAIINHKKNEQSTNDLKIIWDSKPAHLGYIMGMLADLEFINAPKRKNGDINYTQFAKQVFNIFDVKTTENTLSKYLNTTTEKAQETERNFNKASFNIPHKKEVN